MQAVSVPEKYGIVFIIAQFSPFERIKILKSLIFNFIAFLDLMYITTHLNLVPAINPFLSLPLLSYNISLPTVFLPFLQELLNH